MRVLIDGTDNLESRGTGLTVIWLNDGNDAREFALGQDDWAAAARAALECARFAADVDEELIDDDDEQSCYNCRYRRWSAASFTCLGFGDEAAPGGVL